MNDFPAHLPTQDGYGVVTDPATLTIRRLLPGPAERVWRYLTDGDLRRQWFAAGPMEMKQGGTVEFVWRNDELTDPPGRRPPDFPEEHRMESRITEFEPPRRLGLTWGKNGGGVFTLEPRGDEVLLTLVHSRVPDRSVLLNVSAGWHQHLDVLAAVLSGTKPEAFWDGWRRLKGDYEQRLQA